MFLIQEMRFALGLRECGDNVVGFEIEVEVM